MAPPAGGNAVDVLSVDHSISYAYGRAIELYRHLTLWAGPMAGPMASWKSSGNHCAFFVSRRMKDLAGCITKVPLTLYIIVLYICTVYKICEV